jgi:hypothetical protein
MTDSGAGAKPLYEPLYSDAYRMTEPLSVEAAHDFAPATRAEQADLSTAQAPMVACARRPTIYHFRRAIAAHSPDGASGA